MGLKAKSCLVASSELWCAKRTRAQRGITRSSGNQCSRLHQSAVAMLTVIVLCEFDIWYAGTLRGHMRDDWCERDFLPYHSERSEPRTRRHLRHCNEHASSNRMRIASPRWTACYDTDLPCQSTLIGIETKSIVHEEKCKKAKLWK
jgi:hypothetical protein